MYVWPFRLLTPTMQRPLLLGTGQQGPSTMAGLPGQVLNLSGGGFWQIECAFSAKTPDQIRALRAWGAYLDKGATEFILPLIDLKFAPRPITAGAPAKPGIAAAATDYFSEEAGYGSQLIVASAYASATLRATSIQITISQGSSPQGGEHFSIEHETAGWRLYRISRVTARSGNRFTCEIRPPLREAVSESDTIEFDMPRCVMRITPDKADDMELAISLLKIGGSVSTSFFESFDSV